MRRHGQTPLGSARARPLPHLRARLAALGGSALQEAEAEPLGALPLLRVLEPAASTVADSTALGRPGMGTSKKRGSANSDYYTRGHYVPGIKVDGMNVLNVREATRFAKAYALTKGAPLPT